MAEASQASKEMLLDIIASACDKAGLMPAFKIFCDGIAKGSRKRNEELTAANERIKELENIINTKSFPAQFTWDENERLKAQVSVMREALEWVQKKHDKLVETSVIRESGFEDFLWNNVCNVVWRALAQTPAECVEQSRLIVCTQLSKHFSYSDEIGDYISFAGLDGGESNREEIAEELMKLLRGEKAIETARATLAKARGQS